MSQPNSPVEHLDAPRVMERIRGAARCLEGVARRTPVMTSRTLDERAGCDAYLKCDNLQTVGAFKFRGAYHALSRLGDEARERGVLTYSSGNHAQAIAYAGRLLGVSVVVVMPNNAPAGKLAATRAYGAKVVLYEPATATREQLASELPEARTHIIVPPYDHYDVIAGQGTAALELIADAPPLERLLVPTGGGGLLAGCSVAAHFEAPGCRVIGVEPALADDAARSFRSGRIETVHNPATIADGTRTPSLGERNFPLIREFTHDIVTVSEEAIRDAVAFLLGRMKIVVEPSGALGVAALLSGALPAGGPTGVILTGGNVDAVTLADILQTSPL